MALEKSQVVDKVEIVSGPAWKHVQVRVVNQILEDGKVISSSFNRKVFNPDDDWSEEDAQVKGVCDLVHTDEAKAAYAAAQPAPIAAPAEEE